MMASRGHGPQEARNREALEVLAGLRGSPDQHALRRGMLREVEERIASLTARAEELLNRMSDAPTPPRRRAGDVEDEEQNRRDMRRIETETRRVNQRLDQEINEVIDAIVITRQEIEAIEHWMDSIEIDIETAEEIVETVEALRDQNQAFTLAGEAARDAAQQARDEAQTSAGEADGSATAAAGHAQTAETHADEASQSATSAQAFVVAAELARDDAEGYASAASDFVQSAAVHADDAGQSAAAALGWRNEAQTARGEAQTFRNEAATARDDAQGAASTATQASGLAVRATYDGAALAVRNFFVDSGFQRQTLDYWYGVGAALDIVTHSPGAPSSNRSLLITVQGASGSGSGRYQGPTERLGLGGRRIRLRGYFLRDASVTNVQFRVRFVNMNGSYNSFFNTDIMFSTGWRWLDQEIDVPEVNGAYVESVGFWVFGDDGRRVWVTDLSLEDITDSHAAAQSAAAAFNSSVDAYAHATDAEQAAGAAQQDRLAAQTANTNAGVARDAAVSARQGAEQAASAASTHSVTAQMIATGLLPSDFSEGDLYWSSTWAGVPGQKSRVWADREFVTLGGIPMVRFLGPLTSNRNLSTQGHIAAVAGRRYRISVHVRHVGSFIGNSNRFRPYFYFIDSNYNSAGNALNSERTVSQPNVWEVHTLEYVHDGSTPFLNPFLQVQSAWLNSARVLEFRNFVVDEVSDAEDVGSIRATAEQALTTAVSTETALADITQTVTAQYGSWNAFATDTATAIATLDTVAARRVLGVSAGTNQANLTLLAYDGASGSGSAIRMSADNLLLDGTVSARHLIIGSTDNLITNSMLDNADGWSVDTQINGPQNATSDMVSRRMFSIPDSITSNRYIRWNTTVEGGRTYRMQAETRNNGGGSHSRFRFYIQWYNRAGTNFANSAGTTYIETSATPRWRAESFTAPAGAVTANFIFGRLSHSTEVGNLSLGSPSVRLMGDGELTVDGSIQARHIDVQDLAASSAFIGYLSVTEANIAGDFTSDNYNESGGIPTAGFKLERNTGLIKGVGFIDRRGAAVGEFTQAYSVELIPEITESSDLLFPGTSLGTSWALLGSSGNVFNPAGGSVLVTVTGNACLGTRSAYVRVQVNRNGAGWETVAFRSIGFIAVAPSPDMMVWHATFDAHYAAPPGTNSLDVRVHARRVGGGGNPNTVSIFGLKINAIANRR